MGNITPPKQHLGYLDGLRGVAATYVVLHHTTLQLQKATSAEPSHLAFLLSLFSYGHYAVTVFIVLSGFCLMLPVNRTGSMRGSTLEFFKKRAKRILPPYYFAILVCLFLIATVIGTPSKVVSYWPWGNQDFWVWNLSLPVSWKDVLVHVLLLQDIFESTTHKINYIFWSISVEWRIYFLFPLMVWMFRKFGSIFATAILLVVAYTVENSIQFTSLNGTETGPCLHYVGLFAVGMLASQISFAEGKGKDYRDKTPWGVLAVLAFFAGIVMIVKGPGHITWYVNDLFVAAWAFFMLISLSRQQGILHKILSLKPIVFLGTFAYSIYLIHPPIIELVTRYCLPPLHLAWLPSVAFTIAVGTICSLLGAYGFHLSFERPFINSKAGK